MRNILEKCHFVWDINLYMETQLNCHFQYNTYAHRSRIFVFININIHYTIYIRAVSGNVKCTKHVYSFTLFIY